MEISPQTVLALYPALHSLPHDELAALCQPTALLSVPAGAQMFSERQACKGFPLLLAGTIVGVDADGKLQDSGGMDRILRDDTSRLALVACGLLSRYINERVRAQLDWRGHQPWGNLIGQIMSTIVQGENRQRIGAPITSVEWTMKPVPATIVRTGYA